MKIGVRVHDFGKSTPENLAKQAKEMGFDCVQLVYISSIFLYTNPISSKIIVSTSII